ncbi:hypothetical protein [Bacteroides pyogenes]|uniref:hypothetical protein n=1 Tax=Bacteroides pyogenes TaxID=310300 RepID=UPI001BA7A362|nr:hypothetical protein [Bacteroides pyogenes]
MKSNTAGFEKKGGGLFSQAPPPLLHSIFTNCHGVTASIPNAALLTASYIHQAGTGLLLQIQTPTCLLHHTFTEWAQAYCFNPKHRLAYCIIHSPNRCRLTASIPNIDLLTAYTFIKRVPA